MREPKLFPIRIIWSPLWIAKPELVDELHCERKNRIESIPDNNTGTRSSGVLLNVMLVFVIDYRRERYGKTA